MKKLFKFLIAGIICVVVGGAICGGVVLYAIGNPEDVDSRIGSIREKRGYYKVAENRIETIPAEGINKLTLNIDSHDLMIYPTEEQEIKIKYSEEYEKQFSISVSGGSVELTQKNKYDFFLNLFPFSFLYTDYKVELFIPAGCIASLNSDVKSGKIQVENVSFKDADIDCSSGNIVINKFNADSLQVDSKSGRIEMNSVNVVQDTKVLASSGRIVADKLKSGSLYVKSQSGRVQLSGIDCTGKVDVYSSSGSVDCNNITAESLYTKIQSGTSQFEDLNLSGNISVDSSSGRTEVLKAACNSVIVSSSSGSVTVDASKVRASIDIKCSSGSVTVNGVDKDKTNFDLDTSSGSVRLFGERKGDDYSSNSSGNSVSIKVKASSGSIYIND